MEFLFANWNAPKFVKACTTTIDTNQPDSNTCVKNTSSIETTLKNRQRIKEKLQFLQEPAWLNQTHSNQCVDVDQSFLRDADASYSQCIGQPLAILTADCLPIVICHQNQPEIAAIHAGWKGLFGGIIEETLKKCKDDPVNYIAWFGPAICQKCYPVSDEYKNNFLAQYPGSESCFKHFQQWHFSLTAMAEHILKSLGVSQIFHSHQCTFENTKYYSFRRSQGKDGRIATFIWLEEC